MNVLLTQYSEILVLKERKGQGKGCGRGRRRNRGRGLLVSYSVSTVSSDLGQVT